MPSLPLLLTAALAVTASVATYTNPVFAREDSPDPGVAWDPATSLWWAATTTGGAANRFHLRSSPDLVKWTDVGFVFPAGAPGAPTWGSSDYWAPEPHYVAGRWLVYFVARTAGQLSVGVAVSSSGNITGPYVDIGSPLIRDGVAPYYGMIDPTHHVDVDGRNYLIWKRDGNDKGVATPIHIAQLTDNGTALAAGQPDWHSTQLITNDLPFEGGVVEAPWLVRNAGTYFLFYSANGYADGTYAVGVARATSIRGPYVKLGDPILRNASGAVPPWQAPGHCSVVTTAGGRTGAWE